MFNREISLTVVAALLTLVGYSMNDTIVIFDRIRENLNLNRRERLVDVINRSVNQTVSRTVMTSGLTFLTVISLFLFGGPVLARFLCPGCRYRWEEYSSHTSRARSWFTFTDFMDVIWKKGSGVAFGCAGCGRSGTAVRQSSSGVRAR